LAADLSYLERNLIGIFAFWVSIQARKSWVKRSYIEADPVVERFAGLDLGPES